MKECTLVVSLKGNGFDVEPHSYLKEVYPHDLALVRELEGLRGSNYIE